MATTEVRYAQNNRPYRWKDFHNYYGAQATVEWANAVSKRVSVKGRRGLLTKGLCTFDDFVDHYGSADKALQYWQAAPTADPVPLLPAMPQVPDQRNDHVGDEEGEWYWQDELQCDGWSAEQDRTIVASPGKAAQLVGSISREVQQDPTSTTTTNSTSFEVPEFFFYCSSNRKTPAQLLRKHRTRRRLDLSCISSKHVSLFVSLRYDSLCL